MAFYKSTLAINTAASLLCFIFGGFSEFVLMFITFGFVVSIAVKEVRRPNDYLFYYNNGLSKSQLWRYAAIVNLIVALSFSTVYVLFFSR